MARVKKKPVAKKQPAARKKQKAKPVAKKAKAKAKPVAKKAKPVAKKQSKPATKAKPKKVDATKWVRFVQDHGVVLASAKGSVPNVAEAVAGEPIVGSWWGHAKSHAIFDALTAIADSPDIRSFRLVDHKVTFVHRRLWPALARLAHSGILDSTRVASVQQEHLPSGEHRNFEVAFPEWVPDEAAQKAQSLSDADARKQLGAGVI
jgi:hypothetical protein